jgi:hypothetical protein
VSGGYCKFEKGEKSSPVKKTVTKFGAFFGSFHCLPCFEPRSIQTVDETLPNFIKRKHPRKGEKKKQGERTKVQASKQDTELQFSWIVLCFFWRMAVIY